MISGENLKAFFRRWGSSFVQDATSGLNLWAIIGTILGAAGFTATGSSWGWAFLVILTSYLLYVLWKAKPKLIFHPSNFVSRQISLEDLDAFLVKIPTVGLIGKESAGKTTFLNSLVARASAPRQTDKPSVQIIAVPDTNPTKYLAIIDSVGQRDHVQFMVQNRCNALLVFLDHSTSDQKTNVDEARLSTQKYFVDQLIAAKASIDRDPRYIFLIINKADLWTKNPESETRVHEFATEIHRMFRDSEKYKGIRMIERFSNRTSSDPAILLSQVSAIGDQS